MDELEGCLDLARQLRVAFDSATRSMRKRPPMEGIVQKCMVGAIDAALLSAVDGMDALIRYLKGE